jgi:predicted Fe-S protein YdhL (DUF1289 family)
MEGADIYIESPCIDRCCLDDDDICVGCFRSLDEIKQWSSSSNMQRVVILRKANLRQSEKQSR